MGLLRRDLLEALLIVVCATAVLGRSTSIAGAGGLWRDVRQYSQPGSIQFAAILGVGLTIGIIVCLIAIFGFAILVICCCIYCPCEPYPETTTTARRNNGSIYSDSPHPYGGNTFVAASTQSEITFDLQPIQLQTSTPTDTQPPPIPVDAQPSDSFITEAPPPVYGLHDNYANYNEENRDDLPPPYQSPPAHMNPPDDVFTYPPPPPSPPPPPPPPPPPSSEGDI